MRFQTTLFIEADSIEDANRKMINMLDHAPESGMSFDYIKEN